MNEKKVYELDDLQEISAADSLDLSEMSGEENGSVWYNDEYYTTRKNIELMELYAEFNKLYEYLWEFSPDAHPYAEQLRELFWRSSHIVTDKYDDDNSDDGCPDNLYNCVMDPDDEDAFLPLG